MTRLFGCLAACVGRVNGTLPKIVCKEPEFTLPSIDIDIHETYYLLMCPCT